MKFTETPLKGAFIVDLEHIEDNRGFFARAFCRDEFIKRGLEPNIAQCNMSYNGRSGTLRGMHYQVAPHQEVKFVRCVFGRIFDVIVDLREESPTYAKWFGEELSSDNYKALYIPGGFAHGYLTLEDNSVVHYQVSEFYHPESERGLFYADTKIGIKWPYAGEMIISEKDGANPCLK
jgi:dTDP-4-dehydrorhamnose 3,5-epimerase